MSGQKKWSCLQKLAGLKFFIKYLSAVVCLSEYALFYKHGVFFVQPQYV